MDPLLLPPVISIIAGILIFIMPKLLNFIVAGYLVLFGILGLLPYFMATGG